MAKNPNLAWHFAAKTLRDGSPIPPDGEWLKHKGPVEMCRAGLHASERLFDALGYALGSTICRVAVRGVEDREADKLVARERVILWRLGSADDLLREFARRAALSVIDLWDAPNIVRRYLETGDEEIRAAARDAAWDKKTDEFSRRLEDIVTKTAGNPNTSKLLKAVT